MKKLTYRRCWLIQCNQRATVIPTSVIILALDLKRQVRVFRHECFNYWYCPTVLLGYDIKYDMVGCYYSIV